MPQQLRVGVREQVQYQLVLQQLVKGVGGVPGQEQLEKFVEQARRRDFRQQVGAAGYGAGGGGVYAEVELGGEAQDAQHAHRVLGEAQRRLADH